MLFSDVEQSTLLLTRLGHGYTQALDACRAAQRAAWTACHGVEMGTEGDSFFVVFPTAHDAVAAAVQAQRSLAAHDWPDGEQVRVRMGIHTGSPQIHHDGYVGIDVHRAARIASAAHGRQVVVSEVTARLADQNLPADVRMRDLGRHRLKDLNVPEHLYQLLIPEAPADFPPLRSMGTSSSLPMTTSGLLGRRTEVAELTALALDPRVQLVTLTGPGGSGKTRLAIAVAAAVAEDFLDGVYFVPLAAVTTAENMWSGIGEALALPATERTPPAFFNHVTGLSALLVLDNLEQMDGADEAVAALLRQAPRVVVLSTSRRPLHLTSEHQYAVAPLPVPTSDTLAAAEESPAVRLFVNRAQAVRTSFALTAENCSDVAAVCRRLDGLPLAIELAAARSKLLGPRALLARLDRVLDLRGSDSDRDTRQQALRETINWSYRLLPRPQQALFRRIGVFASGADLAALAAVFPDDTSGPGSDVDLLDLTADLVDASLVTATQDSDGEPRFSLLETVRLFALDALAETGELEDARHVHAAHFAEVAAHLDWRSTGTTVEQAIRAHRLFELERNNLREALGWASTSSVTRPEPAALSPHTLGLMLLSRSWFAWNFSDPGESRHWLETLLELAAGEDNALVARCVCAYADALLRQLEVSGALEAAERGVSMLRRFDDAELAEALVNLTDIHAELGNTEDARRSCAEAVLLSRESGDHMTLGDALDRMSFLESDVENWEAALHLLQESRQVYESVGSVLGVMTEDHNTACIMRKLGRVHEAHSVMSKQLRDGGRIYQPLHLVHGAEDYAAVLADAGFAPLAPLVLGACDAERERMGTPPDQRQERERADARAAAQAALTADEWADAYARGRGLTLIDALDEALTSSAGLRV
jgi:predicted ATPase/class 3 adenylate cyclase